jgi:hypothetical protein
MHDFLAFAQKLYAQADTPEVFAWDNSSDNRWLASGVGVYIHDAISSMRSTQTSNPDLYAKLALNPPVGGPAKPNGFSCPDCNVYVVWNFSKNQDTAKEFLKYYFDNYPETFKQSQLYNQPMYANRYKEQLFTAENGKYSVLQNYRGDMLGQSGYPGPPNYAANQVQANYVIPDMVAQAVKTQGEAGIKAALDFARSKLKLYYV